MVQLYLLAGNFILIDNLFVCFTEMQMCSLVICLSSCNFSSNLKCSICICRHCNYCIERQQNAYENELGVLVPET